MLGSGHPGDCRKGPSKFPEPKASKLWTIIQFSLLVENVFWGCLLEQVSLPLRLVFCARWEDPVGCLGSHGPALRFKLMMLNSGWNDQTRAPGNLDLGLSVCWPWSWENVGQPRPATCTETACFRAEGDPIVAPSAFSPCLGNRYTRMVSPPCRWVGSASSDSANHGLKIFETKSDVAADAY